MKRQQSSVMRILCALALIACFLSGTTTSLAEYSFSGDADAIEKAADSVFMLEVYSGDRKQIAVGSGFVAFDSMLLVTNYHVIEGGSYIIAVSDDLAENLITRVCCADKKRDIAILCFEQDSGAVPLPLDTDADLKRSQTVVAIGSPAGLMNTISIGNISAFYTREGKDWIQFTAPISSGSSGGALFNDEGEIIGITTATYASAQNINMAVKIGEVIDLFNRWDKKSTYRMGTMNGNSYPQVNSVKEPSDGSTVWVTKSGKKYHNNPNCSKMRSPIEIDLLEAIEKGYTPCDKCYK